MRKKILASLVSILVLVGAVALFNFVGGNTNAASLPRDCDNNSIIYCGATTPAELKAFYKANKTGDLPAVYSHYGITSAMINSVTDANMGQINKDGSVVFDGKVIATGANSIGRQDIYHPSTKLVINGRTYYQHVPKNTFAVASIKAWIFRDSNGRFIAAILTSCGNPFAATPPPVPPTPPKETYKCDTLSATKMTNNEYTFTAKASVTNGATITGYTYNFGDGKTSPLTGATTTHTYTTPGTYTAKLTVSFKVNGAAATATASSCQVAVTIPTPPQETYKCDALSATKMANNEYTFTAKASVTNGATITGYTYDFGDGTVSPLSGASVSHTYANPGSYTAKLTVSFKVNGATVTATAPTCQVTTTIATPAYACEALGARVLKIEDNSYTYDLSYTATNGATLKTVDYDFGDTQSKVGVTPAELNNVTHAYAVAGTYVTTATLHFNIGTAVKDVKCETSITISPEMCTLIPSIPKNDVRCTPCTVPGDEQYPANSPKCFTPCDIPGLEQFPKGSDQCVTPPVTPPTTPPTTPPELPHTGPMDVVSGSLGLGSLIAAGSYWFASRRNLLGALLNR